MNFELNRSDLRMLKLLVYILISLESSILLFSPKVEAIGLTWALPYSSVYEQT